MNKNCRNSILYCIFCIWRNQQLPKPLYRLLFMHCRKSRAAETIVFTALFAFWEISNCRNLYIYCTLYICENKKLPKPLYLLYFLHVGNSTTAEINEFTALLKNEADVHMFERLAFMARRDNN